MSKKEETSKRLVSKKAISSIVGGLNKHKVAILASGLALCIGVGVGIHSVKSNVPADVTATVKVKGAEKTEVINNINSLIGDIKENNGYIRVVDGEDSSQTYIYNKKGEAVAQGSSNNYLTVFTNDKQGIRYTDTIEKGDDIDILSIISNTLQLAKEGKAVLTKPETIIDGDSKGFKSYNVELNGYDTIKKIYEPVSKEFADKMISSMKEQSNGSDNIELVIKMIIGDEKQFSVSCELLMGSQKYMLWYFDGYLLLYDWELAEDWYSYDFSDTAESEEMLDSLLGKLDEMFKKYADDNNLPEASEESEQHYEGDGHDHSGELGDYNVEGTN